MTPPLPREDLQHVLDRTLPLWEELRGRRIFITGSTGFFGMWLVETFLFAHAALGLGARAVLLTRDPAAFARKAPHITSHPAIEMLVGDVKIFAFPPGEFSHVIHAAATSGTPVPPLEMLDTIFGGTRRVLDFAVAAGASKCLFTSSGAVYGRQPPDLTYITETYPGAPDLSEPTSTYGEGKRVAELLCATYSRQYALETKIARCFAFVGPHLPLDTHFAIGNFLRDALAGVPLMVRGDGTPVRSYLHAADLAIWLWTILFRGTSSRAYNVGSEQGVSIANLACKVRDLLDTSLIVHIARAPDPNRPPARYVPSTARAAEELGLRETIPLEEAIARTATWQRSAGL